MALLMGLIGCRKEDPEPTPIIPDIPNENVNAQYQIVGDWYAEYYWKYSGITEYFDMSIHRDGTLTIMERASDGRDPYLGKGTWKYNSASNQWKLTTYTTMLSGDYVLIGNQFINSTVFEDGSSRTVIFERK